MNGKILILFCLLFLISCESAPFTTGLLECDTDVYKTQEDVSLFNAAKTGDMYNIKLALEEKSETRKKFFVRVKGTGEALKVELAKVFGNIQIIKLANVDDEFGFITDVMSEGNYEGCAKQFPQICHMIRVEA